MPMYVHAQYHAPFIDHLFVHACICMWIVLPYASVYVRTYTCILSWKRRHESIAVKATFGWPWYAWTCMYTRRWL